MIKEAVIKDAKDLDSLSLLSHSYDISFQPSSNQNIDLIAEGQKLSQAKTITTDQMVQIVSNDGTTSYIYPPYAQDSSSITNPNHRINISITYTRNDDGTITLTKHLPEGWARQAAFPIRTDAVVSYYSASGDGQVYTQPYPGSWSAQHADTIGKSVDYTSTYSGAYITALNITSGYFAIGRSFIPINTSAIPDDATINAAAMKIYLNYIFYDINDSNSYIRLVQTDQAATSSLSNSDIDNCGAVTNPTAGASDKTMSSMLLNQFNSFNLNSTGLGWISKTGYTKLGFREGHDAVNITYPNYSGIWKNDGILYYSSEQTGTSTDPYLEVNYTIPNNQPSTPSDLLSEGQTQPTEVDDPTPEFSAVYNDTDAGDQASAYQIQVADAASFSTTTIIWDSGQTALVSTTTSGQRIADISYASPTPLKLDGSTYYWRIKFWDSQNDQSPWSTTTASFTLVDNYKDLQNMSYVYDAVGNITQIVDSSETNTAKTTTYTYDDLNRLTSASTTNAVNGQNYSQTYQYSPIGNITYKSDVGYYTYGGNQGNSFANPHAVTQAGSISYNYDQNGNLASTSAGMVNVWDYDNRLASTTNGAVSEQYLYNVDGSRVSKVSGTSTTLYVSDDYILDNGSPIKYIMANDVRIATIDSTGINYAHTDHLTGTNVESDGQGAISEVVDFTPFGGTRLEEHAGTYAAKKTFTGKEKDSSGLYYFGARYYNSDIGRFASEDPLYLEIGNIEKKKEVEVLSCPSKLNSYSYVENNPLKYIDPLGLETQVFIEKGKISDGITSMAGHAFLVISRDGVDTAYTWSNSDGNTYSGGVYGECLGIVNLSDYLSHEGKNEDQYTKFTFDTTKDQESNIRNFYIGVGETNKSDPKNGNFAYNVAAYNCTDITIDAMKVGGIVSKDFSVKNRFNFSTPSNLNKALSQKNNSQNTKNGKNANSYPSYLNKISNIMRKDYVSTHIKNGELLITESVK